MECEILEDKQTQHPVRQVWRLFIQLSEMAGITNVATSNPAAYAVAEGEELWTGNLPVST